MSGTKNIIEISRADLKSRTIKTPKWINPVEGIITSSFGERDNPVLYKWEFHDGIDISVPCGTEVRTPQDAVVLSAGVSDTFGEFIKLKTKDGYEIFFAHLSKTKAKEGQEVKKGDVVALSGNSGLSTGAHLHYSLWLDEDLIDPIYYVKLPFTEEVKNEYLDRGEYIN